MKRCMKGKLAAGLAAAAGLSVILSGCGTGEDNGKVTIEIIQSKPETATYFDQVEEEFNATHDDIELIIDSPNDANTILKTRFIREDQLFQLSGCGHADGYLGLRGSGFHQRRLSGY